MNPSHNSCTTQGGARHARSAIPGINCYTGGHSNQDPQKRTQKTGVPPPHDYTPYSVLIAMCVPPVIVVLRLHALHYTIDNTAPGHTCSFSGRFARWMPKRGNSGGAFRSSWFHTDIHALRPAAACEYDFSLHPTAWWCDTGVHAAAAAAPCICSFL